ARQGIDLEEASQIEKPRQREQVRGGVQVEGRGEELDYFFRRIRFDFQAYRGSAAPLANGFLDRLEQVFDFVVVDLILAVARHAEGGRVVDGHAREQVREMQPDRHLERREHTALFGRELDEAAQHRGDLDNGEQLVRVLRPLENDGEVERLVGQVREWVAGVDRERRQDREDLALKDFAQVLQFRFRQILDPVADDDSFLLQAGENLLG